MVTIAVYKGKGFKMDKVNNFFKDLIKSSVLGIIVTLIIGIITALIVLIGDGVNLVNILGNIKAVLLFSGGIGLCLGAGFMLKRDARRPLECEKEWKETFKSFNFITFIFVVNIIILTFGIFLDNVVRIIS